MNLKTTNSEILNFVEVANKWLNFVAKDKPTKLSYAVARMVKRCDILIRKFNEEMEDCRADNALTDEKTKALLVDGLGNYQFTREGTQTVVRKRRELLDTEVEIEPYISTETPPDLRNDICVAFEGFVLKPQDEQNQPES